jgi:2-dehydro-3-deoxygluconokinase
MAEADASPAGAARSDGAPEVVTLGEVMVALVAAEPGPLAENGIFQRHVGGAEANVAVGLVRLGHATAFIGRVGPDAFGTAIGRRLRGEGVDCSGLVVESGAQTGILIRERRLVGSSEVLYYRRDSAGSRISGTDVQRAAERGLLGGARWLHLTGITPALSASALDAVETSIHLARDAGLTVSFDVNLRRKLWSDEEARRVLAPLAAQADVVLGSIDELALIGETEPAGRAADDAAIITVADAILGLGPSIAVVKLGSGGALERRRDAEGRLTTAHHKGYPLSLPLDPVGAGDAFVAGYIAATLEGLAPEQALALGNACGAAVAASVGDLHGLPTRDEAERIMATGGPDALR